MAQLSDVLGSIPGLGGYLAKQQFDQQQGTAELVNANQFMRLQTGFQDQADVAKKRMRDDQFRSEIQALGPNPSQEQIVGITSRFASPDKLVDVHQKSLDRQAGVEAAASGRDAARENALTIARERIQGDLQRARERGESEERIAERALEGRKEIAAIMAASRPDRAVTPVTIADPDNPNGTIIIDGRTRQVLGKGPKLTQTGTENFKQATAMQGIAGDLQQAEDLLMGNKRDSQGTVTSGNMPTGSGIGSLIDSSAAWIGVTPNGAAEADALKVVAGKLVQKVPRFEGPQSNADVDLYKEMAGKVGDEKLPIARRMESLRKMRDIYSGYEDGTRGKLVQQQVGAMSKPITPARRASDAAPIPAPPPGFRVN